MVCQEKREIVGEPFGISLDGLIERFCRHTVKFGQFRIEQNPNAANDVNATF